MVVRRRLPLTGAAVAFVTTTTNNFEPVFLQPSIAVSVITQLGETGGCFSVSFIGWTLMPHHLHALIGLPQIERLSEFMQSFKSLSSRRVSDLIEDGAKRRLTISGRFSLWAPRFDDVIVYSPRQMETKLRYIHNNPVKAKLAEQANDWPYSSARDWLGDSGGLIKIDKEWRWS